MRRVALALSGGGFRATLNHLGVVRFLRDAQILPNITHITTVSGGSVLGAHLALNWEAYCGSTWIRHRMVSTMPSRVTTRSRGTRAAIVRRSTPTACATRGGSVSTP